MIDVAEQRRIETLMLPAIDGLLRCMVAEGVADPPEALLALVCDLTPPPDPIAVRYGPMLNTIRSVFRFRGNDVLVEVTIRKNISLVAGLL